MNTIALTTRAPTRPWRHPLPGRSLSLGLGLLWLGLIVLLPLAALVGHAMGLGAAGWLHVLHDARVRGLGPARLALGGEREVRAREAVHELARVLQAQLRADVGAGARVGGCGKREARDTGVRVEQGQELAVIGAEVVPPFAHAMGFVDRD